MPLRHTPIRRKLMTMMMLTSGLIMLLTGVALLTYEFATFRQSALTQLATLGRVIASNSTAALAFQNQDDARETLGALGAEQHIVAAELFDANGQLFASFPDSLTTTVPDSPPLDGYRVEGTYLVGVVPVVYSNQRRLGTLYLQADMGAMYGRFESYAKIVVLIFGLSFLAAYLLSRKLQTQISRPILELAEVAKAVSDRQDYSVRAPEVGRDELGILTEAFNHMLQQIQLRNEALRLAEIEKEKSLQVEAQSLRLQEASRLKSEFLANMSHELRTPLNAIIGFAEIIYDGKVKPETREYREFLGHILISGRHLLQLINDVLDLSKVEAGKLEFRPEPVELAPVVSEVLGILRTGTESKKLVIESVIDPSISDIVLDPSRLKQVLYNFLSNAVKFTPEGGRIAIRVLPGATPEMFRVEVEDSGIGIGVEDIPGLFVEFHQLDAGTAKQHAGTGLGLALTRRLVEAQGGSVGVKSVLGEGSRFHAELPRHSMPGSPVPQGLALASATPGAPKILVVEDDIKDRDALIKALIDGGYSVETANTGMQAIKTCREKSFDAITLDLLLPDLSGIEVLETIRSEGLNREVPIIVVTMVAERSAILDHKVHDLLQKPINSAALLRALDRANLQASAANSV